MGRALPIVLLVAVTVYALVEAVLTPRQHLPRKVWWVLGIVLLPVLGPAAWFVVGRRSRRAPGQQSGGPAHPIAPDDDPDFLRGL